MNILIDHHHGSLFKSMWYLLNQRLGHSLYCPIGEDWLDEAKLYSKYPHRSTSLQMLNLWNETPEFINKILPLTLDNFKTHNIDVIICTLLENYNLFEQILVKYNKKCKLVLHIGNNNSPHVIEKMGVTNLFSSAWCTFISANIPNKVFARQEFSQELFVPSSTCNKKSIINLKHILNQEELQPLIDIGNSLPNSWDIKIYGLNNKNGILLIFLCVKAIFLF